MQQPVLKHARWLNHRDPLPEISRNRSKTDWADVRYPKYSCLDWVQERKKQYKQNGVQY